MRKKRKKCRVCGKYLTKNLSELGKSDYAEEYKDGLCVKCWTKKNKNFIMVAKSILFSPH